MVLALPFATVAELGERISEDSRSNEKLISGSLLEVQEACHSPTLLPLALSVLFFLCVGPVHFLFYLQKKIEITEEGAE